MLHTKSQAYARLGVGYQWHIEPETRVLQVFRLHEGAWVEVAVFGDEAAVCAPPFEDVSLPMGKWWAKLEAEAAAGAVTSVP